MRRKIIIGSMLAVFILMMTPSISAVHYKTIAESNTSQIIEQIKDMDIDELREKIQTIDVNEVQEKLQEIMGGRIYFPGKISLTILYIILFAMFGSLIIRGEIWFAISNGTYYGVEHPIADILGSFAIVRSLLVMELINIIGNIIIRGGWIFY